MSLELRTFRTRVPIRRVGSLYSQPAVLIPGLSQVPRLRDWAAELIAADIASEKSGGLRTAEITAAGLDEWEQGRAALRGQGGAGESPAGELQPERHLVEAIRNAIAEGDRVYVVGIE